MPWYGIVFGSSSMAFSAACILDGDMAWWLLGVVCCRTAGNTLHGQEQTDRMLSLSIWLRA